MALGLDSAGPIVAGNVPTMCADHPAWMQTFFLRLRFRRAATDRRCLIARYKMKNFRAKRTRTKECSTQRHYTLPTKFPPAQSRPSMDAWGNRKALNYPYKATTD